MSLALTSSKLRGPGRAAVHDTQLRFSAPASHARFPPCQGRSKLTQYAQIIRLSRALGVEPTAIIVRAESLAAE